MLTVKVMQYPVVRDKRMVPFDCLYLSAHGVGVTKKEFDNIKEPNDFYENMCSDWHTYGFPYMPKGENGEDNSTCNWFMTTIFLTNKDHSTGDKIIGRNFVAYVMNEDGKTIDVIYA